MESPTVKGDSPKTSAGRESQKPEAGATSEVMPTEGMGQNASSAQYKSPLLAKKGAEHSPATGSARGKDTKVAAEEKTPQEGSIGSKYLTQIPLPAASLPEHVMNMSGSTESTSETTQESDPPSTGDTGSSFSYDLVEPSGG